MDDIVEMVVVGEGEGGISSISELVEVTYVLFFIFLYICIFSGVFVFFG